MLNNINKKIAIHSLQLEVTNRCNLNCPHCFQYENNEKGIYYNDIMDTEVIEHLFNDMGIVRIMNLNFTGGEPLLAEDKIIYVLNKIMNGEAKVFCIDIATNGTILSEKFALKLNDCANYLFEHIENTIREEIDRKENKSIQFRISNAYHGNQAEEAYQFYKKRMPDVSVKIMDDNENVILGYSGRAKNLQSDFFCDSPHHKIRYEEEYNNTVKCPLLVDCFGNLSISAYCTREIKNKNIIGNVSDGKVLRDLIEEWNYRVPLTCKEACDMETYKMHLEKNRLDDIDLKDDVKDIYNGNICGYIFMENYRKLLHKKVTCLTPEEIEKVSILALNLEIKKENNLLLEEELRVENEKIDDCIGKMILEHYYDDVHEEFPHLTHEECIEMKDSITYCKENEGKFTILPYLLKANQLMKLNRYRSTQIKDIFEDEK